MKHISKSIICFTKEDIKFWDEFLVPNSLFNTRGSFIKAHRPYWEYYLDMINEACLLDDELVSEDDFFLEWIKKIDRNGGLVRGSDRRTEILQQYLRETDRGNIVVLTTKKRFRKFLTEIKKIIPDFKSSKTIFLPERLSGIELEPGWFFIKEQLTKCRPTLVISCLGWERVVYAIRVNDLFGANYFDWGGSMVVAGKRHGLKYRIRQIIRKFVK